MTAEEIRKEAKEIKKNSLAMRQCFIWYEIAAQLAELNESLRPQAIISTLREKK